MKLVLRRVSFSQNGTFGTLAVVTPDGETPFCVTLEDPFNVPWIGNTPFNSCIPAGEYLCKRVQSPKFGETFEVMGVHGRDHVLFHKGNTIADTQGCILVGSEFDYISKGIIESRDALLIFKSFVGGLDEFWLTIKDPV